MFDTEFKGNQIPVISLSGLLRRQIFNMLTLWNGFLKKKKKIQNCVLLHFILLVSNYDILACEGGVGRFEC